MIHGYKMQDFDPLRVARVKVTHNVLQDIGIDFVNNGNIADLLDAPVE